MIKNKKTHKAKMEGDCIEQSKEKVNKVKSSAILQNMHGFITRKVDCSIVGIRNQRLSL